MSKFEGLRKARVHCVDLDLREIIGTFLLEITALDPEIEKTIDVEVQAKKSQEYKLPFKNPFSQEMSFSIISSDVKLITIQADSQKLKAQEQKDIVLVIQAIESGSHELFVHINSQQKVEIKPEEEEEDSFTQTFQFKLLAK